MEAPGVVVYHIRERLRARRGNMWYKDTSPRESKTLCGELCGLYDLFFNGKALSWYNSTTGNVHQACVKCVKIRANPQA